MLQTDNFDIFSSPVQEKLEQSPKRDIEGMGVAEIKYGDSLCFIMHMATGLWLSYQAPDVKSARLGPLKRRVSGDKHEHTLFRLQMQSTSKNKDYCLLVRISASAKYKPCPLAIMAEVIEVCAR